MALHAVGCKTAEDELVLAWRLHCLIELLEDLPDGVDVAIELAADEDVDLHDFTQRFLDLTAAGCPPALAVAIVR